MNQSSFSAGRIRGKSSVRAPNEEKRAENDTPYVSDAPSVRHRFNALRETDGILSQQLSINQSANKSKRFSVSH
jgi:hypothetical protein